MDLIQSHIIDISNNHYKYLMSLENVNGIGLGYKWINNISTLEPCIHVLVEKKVDEKYISNNNLIPKQYMGIKTDVINIGKIEAQNSRIEKPRPLEGGCSVGVMKMNGAGTLGCIVTKIINNKKEYFILSNNHVLASLNKTPIGSIIVQPSSEVSKFDPSHIVATLWDFTKIDLIQNGEVPINSVDCAIAKIISPTLISNEIIDIGKITGIANAELDMDIRKSGFMTGFTQGKVHTLSAFGKINFPQTTLQAYFKEQILIKIETKPGDSGCVMVNNDNKIIGLHSSGTGLGFSVTNNIYNVLNKLNIEVYS